MTFELSLNKDVLVNSLRRRVRWWLNLSQTLSVLEKTQIQNLRSLLREITPSEVFEDQPTWRWNKNGEFSVKSKYRHFIDSGANFTDTTWIWKTKCPL